MTRPDADLSRRTFLGTLGTGAAAGLAGCVGGDEGSTGDGRADWPHPYFSPEGAGYNPRATGPASKPGESWGVEVIGIELARPVVFGETVYLATSERLRAFSVGDGTELWSVESDPQSGFRSSVTVDSERVYIGYVGTRTGVLAFTHDGEEAWHAPTESSVWAPVVRPEPDRDRLYASDTAGNLYRVRASDGTVEWREEVFGPVRSLAARYDTVVAGTEGGEVFSFQDEGVERGATGRWRTKHPGGVQALAIAESNDVFAGFFGAGVARLRGGLRAGAVDWYHEDPSPHGSLVVGPRRVFSTDGTGLDAFDKRAGSPSWAAGDDFFAPPAGAGDTVFVSDTSKSGGVVAYDAGGGVGFDDTRIGAERWRYDLAGRALTGPTPAGDALFAVESGGDDGPRRLVALRAE
ncbi:PQQ-binding-like beta-propeller repeat protein [Haloferax prahovense]|uniref:outer membrane protein assembly factor BamB family protein n=1 Tax=Haloferax prahovense TaxID=381852 RepID=UPI003C747E6E